MTFKDLSRGDFFTTKELYKNMYIKTENGKAIDFVLGYQQVMSPDMEVKQCEWFFKWIMLAAAINRFLHRKLK